MDLSPPLCSVSALSQPPWGPLPIAPSFSLLLLRAVMSCLEMSSCLSGVWLCDPMDCSPSGSSVHGTFQARILEKVAVPSPRGSSLESHRVPQIHVREPHWEMVSADVTSEDGVTLGRVALNAVTHVHVRRGERQRQGCGLCRGHLQAPEAAGDTERSGNQSCPHLHLGLWPLDPERADICCSRCLGPLPGARSLTAWVSPTTLAPEEADPAQRSCLSGPLGLGPAALSGCILAKPRCHFLGLGEGSCPGSAGRLWGSARGT